MYETICEYLNGYGFGSMSGAGSRSGRGCCFAASTGVTLKTGFYIRRSSVHGAVKMGGAALTRRSYAFELYGPAGNNLL